MNWTGPGFKHDILKVEGCPDAVPAWDMAIVKAAAKEPLSVEHAQLTGEHPALPCPVYQQLGSSVQAS